eukprot:EG_transcript_32063
MSAPEPRQQSFKACRTDLRERALRRFQDDVRRNRTVRREVLRSRDSCQSCAGDLFQRLKQEVALQGGWDLDNTEEMDLLHDIMRAIEFEARRAAEDAEAQYEELMEYEARALAAAVDLCPS